MSAPLKAYRVPVIAVLEDGEELAVTIDNRDMVRWDETRPLKKWPAPADAPNQYQTFLAWAALTREGQWSEPYESFKRVCVGVVTLSPNGDAVNPTLTDHGGGS